MTNREISRKTADTAETNRPVIETRNNAVDRRVETSIRHHIFRYGELLAGHPVQVFVERIASKLKLDPNFPLKLIVSPDWRTVNACAYPDGTIIISRGLLEFAKSEEEVCGVIAHEYTHVYREHNMKKRKHDPVDMSSIDQALDLIGLMRLQEYEADLRGALELLDKCGSNPNAYKLFLQRLGERETKSEWSSPWL